MDAVPRDPTSLADALDRLHLDGLAGELERLRAYALECEGNHEKALAGIHPRNRASARNLLHYLAIRSHDIRDLQHRLARVGLSSLGRSEPHVLVALERVLGILSLARGRDLPPPTGPAVPVGFREGEDILARNATALLGPPPAHRPVRIMVTLPSEAASDPALVRSLLEAGMDCARINTAHDDEGVWDSMADHVVRARRDLGVACRILADLPGPKLRTGDPRPAVGDDVPRIHVGHRIRIVPAGAADGAGHPDDVLLAVPCEIEEVFRDARAGHAVWFDDGKLGGRIVASDDRGLLVEVTHAGPKGVLLKPEKGINLPETRLALPALGPDDRRNLAFAARRADAVGLSFVHEPEDVEGLHRALADAGAPGLGILLKIETRAGFANLPGILLAAMQGPSFGVMIARGDLAVEAGFERLAEVQEEILWVAESAHAPTVWATQVLEGLAKKGVPSRAEVTDAAMSARAEAVMLNKGPYIVDAIRTLDDILTRMAAHQRKKSSLLRPLGISRGL